MKKRTRSKYHDRLMEFRRLRFVVDVLVTKATTPERVTGKKPRK